MSRRATAYALLIGALAFGLVLNGMRPRRDQRRANSTWYLGGRL